MQVNGYPLAVLILLSMLGITAATWSPAYPLRQTTTPLGIDSARDKQIIENESLVLNLLRELVPAQNTYAALYSDDETMATFEQLLQATEPGEETLIPNDFQILVGQEYASKNGYLFQLFLSPDKLKYCAYAWPESQGVSGNFSFFSYNDEVFKAKTSYSGSDNRPEINSAFPGRPFADSPKDRKASHDGNDWILIPGTE